MKYVLIAVALAFVASAALVADYVGVFERFKRVEQEDEPPMGEV